MKTQEQIINELLTAIECNRLTYKLNYNEIILLDFGDTHPILSKNYKRFPYIIFDGAKIDFSPEVFGKRIEAIFDKVEKDSIQAALKKIDSILNPQF